MLFDLKITEKLAEIFYLEYNNWKNQGVGLLLSKTNQMAAFIHQWTAILDTFHTKFERNQSLNQISPMVSARALGRQTKRSLPKNHYFSLLKVGILQETNNFSPT